MFDLSGKRVLVTGASGGIGAAIARALYDQGAAVALSGTREAALRELAESLGDRTHVAPCVLSDRVAVAALPAAVEEALGGLDVLVNNAGVTRDTLAMRMRDEDWDDVLEINLTAAFRLSRACLRGMMKQRNGRIINITSIVGVVGNPGQANYVASKAGMIGLTKSMAAEVASRGITVNAVAPGYIETPMTDALNADQREKILSSIPSGRIGQPAEVAGACAFLASDEAAYITGQTLHVNGGMAMI